MTPKFSALYSTTELLKLYLIKLIFEFIAEIATEYEKIIKTNKLYKL